MGARARASILLLAVVLTSAGCYTARMQRMETTLGSLQTRADSDSVTLSQMRSDLAEQREILLSLKAGSNTTSKELVDRLEELSNKLDDTVQRMSSLRYQNPLVNRAPGDTTYIGYSGGAAYMSSLGLPAPSLVVLLAIIIEVGGGLLMLVGYQTRIASLGLGIYVLLSALIAHSQLGNPDHLLLFMKNIAIAGGSLAFFAFGGGAYSLDARPEVLKHLRMS